MADNVEDITIDYEEDGILVVKDLDKVVFHIPMPLRFTEPQRKGRGFEVPGEFKLSGIEFRYPGSARYADGI